MIGLGSNRLSVCRRGGMSVTQAGRGGMEWLAGGRVPDWVTPYSAQATAALKAQFPTQWPTIRDYGFAHPEIVGYMNAYAPEDAKIAYSLVEGIGVRGVVTDGQSYADLGWKATGGMHAFIQAFVTSTTKFYFGSHNTSATGSSNNYNRNQLELVGSSNQTTFNTLNMGNGNVKTGQLNIGHFNEIEVSSITEGGVQPYFVVNGTRNNITGVSGTLAPNNNVRIFYYYWEGKVPTAGVGSEVFGVEIGTIYRWIIGCFCP